MLSRRHFIQRATLAASIAAMSAPAFLRGQNLNGRVALAGIGVDGKGASDIDGSVKAGADVVALCDIDAKRLAKAGQKYPGAKLFADYRKMFEEMPAGFDAVTVSTPDHHHAPAAAMAMKLGKHAYVQKPLTHSIGEARQLLQLAREKKVATLMGNQGHSGNDVRNFCEFVWAGAIGDISEVHCWTDRPGGYWKQGLQRPVGEKPVPEHISWDLFLGPAPERPYHEGYHPFAWRGWWDFGTGSLGDMGCHILDPVRWALKLGHATSVEAEQEGKTDECGPKWAIITYQFPARGALPPVKLVWYDGGKKPSNELLGLAPEAKSPGNGSLFLGNKGKMTCETYGGGPKFTPDSAVKEFAKPPQGIH
jgi:predicted dehydrogenase